ncbi:C6 finger domain [Mycena indigotica]|uniref:C6 finger domain n=1 Tax=Mycena indigotica TaxID=2126181 RepID=A0A8H6S2W3_9AGAR|nr:C6 finger domain [Mycena indigotica]KAF7290847.1 C6 finger domain [Mycena indigotica]
MNRGRDASLKLTIQGYRYREGQNNFKISTLISGSTQDETAFKLHVVPTRTIFKPVATQSSLSAHRPIPMPKLLQGNFKLKKEKKDMSSSRTSRSMVACMKCRRVKAKCAQSENPPQSACARCRLQNITCEYPLAEDPRNYEDNVAPSSSLTSSRMRIPGPQRPPVKQRGNGSVLPYTGPPPPATPPRYSSSEGRPYPNLGLGPSTSSEPSTLPWQRSS